MTRHARYGAFLLLQETGFLDGLLKIVSSNIKSGFFYRNWYLPLIQRMNTLQGMPQIRANCTIKTHTQIKQAP
jgi:hypothetical protein